MINITKKQIRKLNAMQICLKLTRLQFNEEVDEISAREKKEMMMLEGELRKRLAQALIGG